MLSRNVIIRRLWVVGSVAAVLQSPALAGGLQFAASREAEARDALYSLDFDAAEAEFQALTAEEPDNPRYWNLLASSIWLRIVFEQEKMNLDAYSDSGSSRDDADDLVSPEREERLRGVLARAIAAAEAILEAEPEDREALYALGIAHGSLASFEATVKKAYLSANGAARVAREHHMRLLELDPSYNDARLTIGAYDYTVGALPLFLRALIGLVGIRGDKEGGIEQLEYAAELGDRGAVNAKVVLVVVYNREEQYEKALALLEELHAAYPRNFLFELEQASVHRRMEDWDRAVAVYDSILAQIRSGGAGYDRLEPESVLYRKAEAHIHGMDNTAALETFRVLLDSPETTEPLEARARLWMGKIYDSDGQRTRAVAEYERVLALDAPDDVRDEAGRYVRRPFQG